MTNALKAFRTSVSAHATFMPEGDVGYDLGLDASDFATFRGHYIGETGIETTLTDEQICEVVAATDDDMEPAAWVKLMRAKELELSGETETWPAEGETATVTDPANDVIVGRTMQDKAAQIASKFDADLSAALDKVANAKEDLEGGTLAVHFALKKTFGEEELASWPEPDADTGNNPDKMKVPVIVDGKTVLRNSSFYVQMFGNTATGKALMLELDYLNTMSNDKADQSSVPDDYAAKYRNPVVRKARKTYLQGRMGSMRNALKKAVKFSYQLDRVNSLPGVQVSILMDETDKSKVRNVVKPILIDHPSDKTIWELFSVGAFLRLDAGKAKEKGGTYANLMDTKKREPKSGTGATTTKVESIKTVGTFVNAIAEMHLFTDKVFGGTDPKDQKELYKLVNAPDNDELITSIVELRDSLNTVITSQKLTPRYVAIQNKGALAKAV